MKSLTISYEDLIGCKYKDHGRSKTEGFDCYGLIIELTRRMGTPLRDVWYEDHNLELADKNAPTLNVVRTDKIDAGTILEMQFNDELHIGMAVNSKQFIHTTRSGVRVSPIGSIKIIGLYNVCN